MPDPTPQRQHARYRIQLPFLHRVKGPASGKVGVGWSRNLSEGGACLELAEPLTPSTPLDLLLQTNQGPIRMEADVVWSGERAAVGGGVLQGVAFTRVAPNQRQALRNLLVSKGQVRHAGIRLPLDLAVTCRPKGHTGPPLLGRTADMSRGGLSLRLPEPLPPGQELEIILHSPSGPLTAEGAVVWVEPSERRRSRGLIRHGFQFTVFGWTTSLSLGLLLVEPL